MRITVASKVVSMQDTVDRHLTKHLLNFFRTCYFPPRSISLSITPSDIFGLNTQSAAPATAGPVPTTPKPCGETCADGGFNAAAGVATRGVQKEAEGVAVKRADDGNLTALTHTSNDQRVGKGAADAKGGGGGGEGGDTGVAARAAITSSVHAQNTADMNTADVNAADVSAEDTKAMIQAAKDGNTGALETLLHAEKSYIQARDKDGRTCLIVALTSGQVEAAEMLLAPTSEAGLLDAQGSTRYDRKNALMWASKRGMTSMVQKLVALPTDVELTDEDGRTALMLAAANGHEKEAEILLTPTLTAGGDLDAQDTASGRSALMFAGNRGLKDFCRLLLSYGARPELTDKNGATSLMLALEHATAKNEAAADILLAPTSRAGVLDVQDANTKQSALHKASSRGYSAIVQKLLDLNASPALTDKNGCTPLLLAIFYAHEAVADVLLTPSAQAGVLQVIGTGKMSALCRACEKGLPRVVQRLLALDADPRWSDRDGNGNTPLMLAIANGHAATADLFLSTKPEPQVAALNVQGTGAMRSALMRASEKGMAATVEKLLGLGVKVSLRDKYGKTALILAIENSHEAVAEMLLPSTAQAGALDFQGTGAMDRKSALMIASKKGLSSIVHTLLQLLADTQIKDPQGKTALDLARENGHQGCISLLEPRTSFEP